MEINADEGVLKQNLGKQSKFGCSLYVLLIQTDTKYIYLSYVLVFWSYCGIYCYMVYPN